MEYRITPSLYFKYQLERKVLFVFWEMVALSDDYNELVKRVEQVGGNLIR